MTLNYTPLRHKMLANVDQGAIHYIAGVGGDWGRYAPVGSVHFADRRERGVVEVLAEFGCLGIDPCDESPWQPNPERPAKYYRSPAHLSAIGVATLSAWTDQHGEPS